MKSYKVKNLLLIMFVIVFSLSQAACYEMASEGEAIIQTKSGQITRVIRPSDGTFVTIDEWMDEYFIVDLKEISEELVFRGTTPDNANFNGAFLVSFKLLPDDTNLITMSRQFGLDGTQRYSTIVTKIRKILTEEAQRIIEDKTQLVETTAYDDTGKAFTKKEERYNAYAINLRKSELVTSLKAAVKDRLPKEVFVDLITLTVKDNFDFDNDEIDLAASKVVANQKKKEAAQAALDAAQIEAQTQKIEGGTLAANPGILELRKLDKLIELEKVKAGAYYNFHGQTLVVQGSSSSPQVQVPVK